MGTEWNQKGKRSKEKQIQESESPHILKQQSNYFKRKEEEEKRSPFSFQKTKKKRKRKKKNNDQFPCVSNPDQAAYFITNTRGTKSLALERWQTEGTRRRNGKSLFPIQ